MSFASILRTIVGECGGGLGAALMGRDGIPIEQVSGPAARDLGADDVAAAGVELGRILDEVRKAGDVLAAGAPSELVVSFVRFVLVLRAVDEETFVVLALTPDGNLGRARYLIRRHLLALRDEL